MTTVDELFDQFRASYRAGEDADPRRFLDRVSGVERRELEALIDAFLAAAPGDPWDLDAFERFTHEPLRRNLRRAVEEQLAGEESWRTLLKRARTEAQLPRSTVVARLAQALGVAAGERKVADYYHRMELGTLPAQGVSGLVLEALSQIIDVPVERLRAAGERLAPRSPGSSGPVFARTASQSVDYPSPMASPSPPAEEWDQVDQLFRGG
jgi:hypothetical protein